MLFASSFELVARVVLGDWDRARGDAGELHAIALDIDNHSELDDFVWTQAYVAAARGEADRHAALAVLVDPRRDPRVALCGGLLALGRDAPGEAVAALSDHVTPGDRAGYADPDMSPFDLAEALIRIGEHDKAEALLSSYEPLRGCSWVAAGLARCRALAGKEGFEALYAESRAALDSIGFVFEVARTDLYLGETLRRQRRRGEAREPLARALAAFERLGAAPWAGRARAGLRAAGAATEAIAANGQRGAERARAAGRRRGRRGEDEPGDRRRALPEPSHRRAAPRGGVPQARHPPPDRARTGGRAGRRAGTHVARDTWSSLFRAAGRRHSVAP